MTKFIVLMTVLRPSYPNLKHVTNILSISSPTSSINISLRTSSSSFYTEEVHKLRMEGLAGSQQSYEAYAQWFVRVIDLMPSVYHYSWFDLERKIKTYKNYWQTHWESLYNIKQEDTPENNMFFDKRWSDVTEEEIKDLAKDLGEKLGGWVFHQKVNFETPTPWIQIEDITHPKPWLDYNE